MDVKTASNISPFLRWMGRHWAWLSVGIVILLVAVVRLRLQDMPLERDEGEYAYAGQLMLQGIPPYQMAYNMKFPGTYAAYAIIMALFGQTPAGIHIGVMLVTSLTAALLFWLGRRLLDETAGFVAGSAYALLAATSGMLGLAGHATHFAALFATASACLLLGRPENLLSTALGGLMAGTALVMKQHAAAFCLWGFVVVMAGAMQKKSVSILTRLRAPVVFGLSAIIPFGITCLLLSWLGVFDKFWFWTIQYARSYISQEPLSSAWAYFESTLWTITSRSEPLWALAVLGLVFFWFDSRLRGSRFALATFGLASFLTTCPGLYFRNQYFLLTLPAVSLFAGCIVSKAGSLAANSASLGRFARWPVWSYAVIIAFTLMENWDVWVTLKPDALTRLLYLGNPFADSPVIAKYIRDNSAPSDRIAVLGSEPQLYFLSRRGSATGYIYTYPLMEPQPYAEQMQLEMIHEIETAQPRFVVLVSSRLSWLMRDSSHDTILQWWVNSYRTNYQLVGSAELVSPILTHFQWGESLSEDNIDMHNALLVYRLKAATPSQQ